VTSKLAFCLCVTGQGHVQDLWPAQYTYADQCVNTYRQCTELLSSAICPRIHSGYPQDTQWAANHKFLGKPEVKSQTQTSRPTRTGSLTELKNRTVEGLNMCTDACTNSAALHGTVMYTYYIHLPASRLSCMLAAPAMPSLIRACFMGSIVQQACWHRQLV